MTEHNQKDSTIDGAMIVAKAGLSLFPGGGILSILLESYIPTTWQKRTEESLAQIREDYERLKSQLKDDRLRSEDFHITMIKIIRDIVPEQHKEKQEAFRAILLNEAIQDSAGSETDFFIKITEDLTSEHILALKVLADPSKAYNEYPAVRNSIDSMKSLNREGMGGDSIISRLLKPALPDILEDHWLVVLDGLTRSGLIIDPGVVFGGRSGWTSPKNSQNILQKKTTLLGDRYIRYITLP